MIALSYLIIRTTEHGIVLTGWGFLILWIIAGTIGSGIRRDRS